jgi:hypothetical protein
MQRLDLQRAEAQPLALVEQHVELAAVDREVVAEVVEVSLKKGSPLR